MHNLKDIRNNVDKFKSKIKERNVEIDFDKLLSLDKENRVLIQNKEKFEQEKKIISKSKDSKNFEKSKKLRKEFIKNSLHIWFSYLENLLNRYSSDKEFFTDKFSIADITAWRLIHWFVSGKLDLIDASFLDELPILKNYHRKLSQFEPFSKLSEFKEILNQN